MPPAFAIINFFPRELRLIGEKVEGEFSRAHSDFVRIRLFFTVIGRGRLTRVIIFIFKLASVVTHLIIYVTFPVLSSRSVSTSSFLL